MFTDCLSQVLEMRQCDVRKVALPPDYAQTARVLASILATRPRAIVMNTDLGPHCSAVELVAALAARGMAVIAVADTTDEAHWGHCLASGARIVIPKDASLAMMVSVIRRISRGERVLDLADRERLLSVYSQHSAERRQCLARLDLLSPQESEILLQLIGGRTVREIAAHRVVSEYTVRTQVKAVLSKLGVSSQLAAVAVARTAGWGKVAVTAGRSA